MRFLEERNEVDFFVRVIGFFRGPHELFLNQCQLFLTYWRILPKVPNASIYVGSAPGRVSEECATIWLVVLLSSVGVVFA